MPKVDPTTGEPMSDAPEGDDATRGGKERGDPALEGATETGRSGIGFGGPRGGTVVEDDYADPGARRVVRRRSYVD